MHYNWVTEQLGPELRPYDRDIPRKNSVVALDNVSALRFASALTSTTTTTIAPILAAHCRRRRHQQRCCGADFGYLLPLTFLHWLPTATLPPPRRFWLPTAAAADNNNAAVVPISAACCR